jgi:hypothetical protein
MAKKMLIIAQREKTAKGSVRGVLKENSAFRCNIRKRKNATDE